MRDAFGSTFMFKLIIVFIVFYVSFMTIAVGYAKVFKIKNEVINFLEQYQVDTDSVSDWNNVVIGKIDPYLDRSAYRRGDNNTVKGDCSSKGGKMSSNGVCIVKNNLKIKNKTDNNILRDDLSLSLLPMVKFNLKNFNLILFYFWNYDILIFLIRTFHEFHSC